MSTPPDPVLPRAVIAVSEHGTRARLASSVKQAYELAGIYDAAGPAAAEAAFLEPDVALVDLHLGGHLAGTETLRRFAVEHPETLTVAVAGAATLNNAQAALAAGARAVISEPFRTADVLATLGHFLAAEDRHRARRLAAGDELCAQIWTFQAAAPDCGQSSVVASVADILVESGHQVLVMDAAPADRMTSSEAGDLAAFLAAPSRMGDPTAVAALPADRWGVRRLVAAEAVHDGALAAAARAASESVDYLLVDLPFASLGDRRALCDCSHRVFLSAGPAPAGFALWRSLVPDWRDRFGVRLTPYLARGGADPAARQALEASFVGLPSVVSGALPEVDSGGGLVPWWDPPLRRRDAEYKLALLRFLVPLVGRAVAGSLVEDLDGAPAAPRRSLFKRLVETFSSPPLPPQRRRDPDGG